MLLGVHARSLHLPCQLPWGLTTQVSTSNWSQAGRKTQKVRKENPSFKSSDYILEADSVALAPGLAVHPADLSQSGNLHRHLSKPEQTLEKNGLLRSPGGQQTEPPVGDVLHSSTEDRRFLSGLKRRQLASLEFSSDGIARILSFCPRLHAVHTSGGSCKRTNTKLSEHYEHSRQEGAAWQQSYKLAGFSPGSRPARPRTLATPARLRNPLDTYKVH